MGQTTATRRDDGADVINNIDAATAAAGSTSTDTGDKQQASNDPKGLEALFRQRLPFWAYWERLNSGRDNAIRHLAQHLAEATGAVIVGEDGRPIDTHTESPRSNTWGVKWTTSGGEWALGFGPDEDDDSLYVVHVKGPQIQWRGTGVTADQVITKFEALDVFPSASGTING